MNDGGDEGGLAGHEEAAAPCGNCQENTGAEDDKEYEVKDTHLCAPTERCRHMCIVIRVRGFAETTGIDGGHSLIVGSKTCFVKTWRSGQQPGYQTQMPLHPLKT